MRITLSNAKTILYLGDKIESSMDDIKRVIEPNAVIVIYNF